MQVAYLSPLRPAVKYLFCYWGRDLYFSFAFLYEPSKALVCLWDPQPLLLSLGHSADCISDITAVPACFPLF